MSTSTSGPPVPKVRKTGMFSNWISMTLFVVYTGLIVGGLSLVGFSDSGEWIITGIISMLLGVYVLSKNIVEIPAKPPTVGVITVGGSFPTDASQIKIVTGISLTGKIPFLPYLPSTVDIIQFEMTNFDWEFVVEGSTKDGVLVKVPVSITGRPDVDNLPAYNQAGGSERIEEQLLEIVVEAAKMQISTIDVADLAKDSSGVSNGLASILNLRSTDFGIIILKSQAGNVKIPREMEEAMSRSVVLRSWNQQAKETQTELELATPMHGEEVNRQRAMMIPGNTSVVAVQQNQQGGGQGGGGRRGGRGRRGPKGQNNTPSTSVIVPAPTAAPAGGPTP